MVVADARVRHSPPYMVQTSCRQVGILLYRATSNRQDSGALRTITLALVPYFNQCNYHPDLGLELSEYALMIFESAPDLAVVHSQKVLHNILLASNTAPLTINERRQLITLLKQLIPYVSDTYLALYNGAIKSLADKH